MLVSRASRPSSPSSTRCWFQLAISLQSIASPADAWILCASSLHAVRPWRCSASSRQQSLRPCSSTRNMELHNENTSWKGSMSPFSNYAVHVQVDKEDAAPRPVSVCDAILRSMGDKVVQQQPPPRNGDYDDEPSSVSLDPDLIATSIAQSPPNTPLTPQQLLYLGSVWYMSSEQYELHQRQQQDPTLLRHLYVRPERLSLQNATKTLREGDYLRIHHTPRRFPRVYQVDWSMTDTTTTTTMGKRGDNSRDVSSHNRHRAVIQQGPGYVIIDKPPQVPVHASVDNEVENVVHQLLYHNHGNDNGNHHRERYLAPVQRIDVNTSGLLVLGTSPDFAAYFAKLLRHKTKDRNVMDHKTLDVTKNATGNIEKEYNCLVCLCENGDESVTDAWKLLASMSRPDVVVRHYLKATERNPKIFVKEIPMDNDQIDADENADPNKAQWLECILKITHVSSPIPLYSSGGNHSSLVHGLWPPASKDGPSIVNRMPQNARAVAEVKVSLITGRTHQIRGQLSEMGFPIVGDEQYGGAIPLSDDSGSYEGGNVNQWKEGDVATEESPGSLAEPQLLALQCCGLSFPEPEYESVWNQKRRKEVVQGLPNKNILRTRVSLNRAWWTALLENHGSIDKVFGTIDQDLEHDQDGTFADDSRSLLSIPDNADIRSDLLPPSVQLTPGRNKYVLAKLRDPKSHHLRWFVKSAPLPYHADVADDLKEWVRNVPGYETVKVEITGGGRIDYIPEAASSTFDGAASSSECGGIRVYGFSYRYGKGDHKRAAELIQESLRGTDKVVSVSYDLSDDLY